MSGVTDPVADMVVRIRNAIHGKKKTVDVPASKLKISIVRILKDEGFIKNYRIMKDNRQGNLRMYLKYTKDTGESVIRGLKRLSKPGRRVYKPNHLLPRPLGGLGTAIVTTSKGVLTDKECRSENIGGELLLEIW